MNLNERITSSLHIDNNSASYSNGDNAQNKTMWNWFTKNRLVNTLVEKVVTTIDPQMKEFIRKSFQFVNRNKK